MHYTFFYEKGLTLIFVREIISKSSEGFVERSIRGIKLESLSFIKRNKKYNEDNIINKNKILSIIPDLDIRDCKNHLKCYY